MWLSRKQLLLLAGTPCDPAAAYGAGWRKGTQGAG